MLKRTKLPLVALLLSLAFLVGCATAPPRSCEELWSRSDPLEGWNRPVHGLNRWVDRTIYDPLIEVWMWVPEAVRNRFTDFGRNLRAPRNVANNLLQADLGSAGTETARFLVNTTVGVGGLYDVAGRVGGVKADPEDFGQTLAVWGLGAGPYVEIPLRGPATFRSLAGDAVDSTMSVAGVVGGPVGDGITVLRYGNRAEKRARIDDELDEAYEINTADSYRDLQCRYYRERFYRTLDGRLPDEIEKLEQASVGGE